MSVVARHFLRQCEYSLQIRETLSPLRQLKHSREIHKITDEISRASGAEAKSEIFLFRHMK